jgi:hypothetical protein
MEAALKREGKRLFESGRGVMGGYYPHKDSVAWCCAQYRVNAFGGSKGPQKVKQHLRSANHFREWCIEFRDKAIERFPEVKALFAEFELTKVEKPVAGVSSTTSLDITPLARGLLGRRVP